MSRGRENETFRSALVQFGQSDVFAVQIHLCKKKNLSSFVFFSVHSGTARFLIHEETHLPLESGAARSVGNRSSIRRTITECLFLDQSRDKVKDGRVSYIYASTYFLMRQI